MLRQQSLCCPRAFFFRVGQHAGWRRVVVGAKEPRAECSCAQRDARGRCTATALWLKGFKPGAAHVCVCQVPCSCSFVCVRMCASVCSSASCAECSHGIALVCRSLEKSSARVRVCVWCLRLCVVRRVMGFAPPAIAMLSARLLLSRGAARRLAQSGRRCQGTAC